LEGCEVKGPVDLVPLRLLVLLSSYELQYLGPVRIEFSLGGTVKFHQGCTWH
jgi:hypothetical protein